MGVPLELVRCENSDLQVPANAEFIFEGTVDFSQRVENLLGEFAGQYGPEDAPVTTVNTITHRDNALYYTILAGRNAEHNLIGNVAAYGIQRSIAGALTEAIPSIKRIRVFLEPGLGTMCHIVIAIDKTDDAEPRQIIEQAFATHSALFPISTITKRIVVVDDDVDVENLADVEWAIWTRAAAAEKFILTLEHVQTMKPEAIIMHPLPRVDEIPEEVNEDPRAQYFQQAQNGLYIRMALLYLLLQ